MRAVTVPAGGGLDRLRQVDLPDPGAPGPGEVRVRIRAMSLNAHDLQVAAGQMSVADGRIPLCDGAGVVEAVGDGVTELAEGDDVVSAFFPQWLDGPPRIGDFAGVPGDGLDGYAVETVVYPARNFTRAPRGLSHAQSATITTAGVTAWRALVVNGGLKAGDTVLVLGSGGVSVWALQIARAAGARVLATSSSSDKRRRLEELGASATFDYVDNPDWGKEVHDWTGGVGVDHVVEVGGPKTLPASIDALRIGGHITMVGVITGGEGVVPTLGLMVKQAVLQGMIVGSRRDQTDLVRAVETSQIAPVLDRHYDLADLTAGFEHLASGQHFGKVIVQT